MSYHEFAAGAARFGVYVAARAAWSFGLTLEQTLAYLHRYTVEGNAGSPSCIYSAPEAA